MCLSEFYTLCVCVYCVCVCVCEREREREERKLLVEDMQIFKTDYPVKKRPKNHKQEQRLNQLTLKTGEKKNTDYSDILEKNNSTPHDYDLETGSH